MGASRSSEARRALHSKGSAAAIAGGAAGAALFLASAVYGFTKDSVCRREWSAWMQVQSKAETEEKARREAALALRPPGIQAGIVQHRFVVGMTIDEAIMAQPSGVEVCHGKRTTTAEAVIEEAPVCRPTCAYCPETKWRLHLKDGALAAIDEF